MNAIPADPERLTQLLRELDDLNIAEKIVEGTIQTETRHAGFKLIESSGGEIQRLGNKFGKAFVDLHTASFEYDRYIDSLEETGANVGQYRIRPNGLSHPADRSGNFFYAITEFIDSKFLSQSDMPKVLRS
jgi:hypothetical protein